MNILLIWEEIPDYTKMYKFKDIGEDVSAKILLCHEQFINSVELDPQVQECLDWLSETLDSCTPEPDGMPVTLDGEWTVVVSGFVM